MRQLVLLLGGLIGSLAGKPPGERQLTILRRDPAPTGASGQTQYAVFAAGCFWGVELAFARLPGVLYTDVGYTGGTTESPTYTTVSRGTTGHAEAVRIGYDPSLIRQALPSATTPGCHVSPLPPPSAMRCSSMCSSTATTRQRATVKETTWAHRRPCFLCPPQPCPCPFPRLTAHMLTMRAVPIGNLLCDTRGACGCRSRGCHIQ